MSFTVRANGRPPISYQWYQGAGTPIVGATSSTYTIARAELADAGTYYCIASNYYNGTAYTATRRVATRTSGGWMKLNSGP